MNKTITIQESNIWCNNKDQINYFLSRTTNNIVHQVKQHHKTAYAEVKGSQKVAYSHVSLMYDKRSMLGRIQYLPPLIEYMKQCEIQVEKILENWNTSSEAFQVWLLSNSWNQKIVDLSKAIKEYIEHLEQLVFEDSKRPIY